ncbi:hypothetical protein [Pseudotamlana carrageenivorans]|uniref:Lipoprotein n=1 Tax=Pseudotamlana carrageenivorans TaxID=2069432 RepID=A0A2I7SLZ5_9FLAO|nr:hypothetical protein [Tamlana carrageenivorans]AUS06912.1 hypothetical protein C1A40_16325 [Tamlana carrageenivorans]
MRTFIYLVIILFFASCTDLSDGETYTYTVKNKSGVPVKIYAFNSNSMTPGEVIHTITLQNNEELTKKFEDGSPPKGYNFSDFFGKPSGRSVTDSIRVIYDNTKHQSFNSKNCNGEDRNPINICAYQGVDESFTFTAEDYKNAVNCNSNCE